VVSDNPDAGGPAHLTGHKLKRKISGVDPRWWWRWRLAQHQASAQGTKAAEHSIRIVAKENDVIGAQEGSQVSWYARPSQIADDSWTLDRMQAIDKTAAQHPIQRG
jgi:hypothetical protein